MISSFYTLMFMTSHERKKVQTMLNNEAVA